MSIGCRNVKSVSRLPFRAMAASALLRGAEGHGSPGGALHNPPPFQAISLLAWEYSRGLDGAVGLFWVDRKSRRRHDLRRHLKVRLKSPPPKIALQDALPLDISNMQQELAPP